MPIDKREQPKVFGCLIGTVAGIVLTLLLIIALGFGLRVIMVLPAWLGLITPLLPEDVTSVEIPGTAGLELGATRRYLIFTQRRVTSRYNLCLESVTTGEPVQLQKAPRAIQYETAAVTGTLIYQFSIDQPGTYRLSADQTHHAETLLIAPDYTGRNQTVLALFYAPFLFILGGSAWLFWRRGMRPDKAQAQSKKDRWNAWVDDDSS